ncbi:hypothetical protein ElP_57180 [Tautonia plasticadhaerens]|uniref:3-keto-alpha-glucoside-1,2-lyase/3-keto-2-hydroxy-glucal hydratase domain-containing protein n=2 Tax=Tautonia plasticadhaerens TaxID=2527974 RepID=A0A518HA92_9BACT|nr:hypothetical protein ElP_57180 [Tautonia plasticadhaerens]
MYHGVGAPDPATGWLESAQFGILEGGETGDFYGVPGAHGARVVADVRGEGIPAPERRYPSQSIRYRPDGRPFVGTTAGILNRGDRERPVGQWNALELICFGPRAIHVVNGEPSLAVTNLRRRLDGREVPLVAGRLQLQSEGAEMFFRRGQIRPIDATPPEFRDERPVGPPAPAPRTGR